MNFRECLSQQRTDGTIETVQASETPKSHISTARLLLAHLRPGGGESAGKCAVTSRDSAACRAVTHGTRAPPDPVDDVIRYGNRDDSPTSQALKRLNFDKYDLVGKIPTVNDLNTFL